jgi:hypothetical protein
MTQLNRDELKGMTPQEIADAHEAGRLDLALGAHPDDVALVERAAGVINAADMAALRLAGRDDLIVKAHNEDRIDTNNPKDDK